MDFHKAAKFKRQYKRLATDIKKKAGERLLLLAVDPFNPLLNNHKLGWNYESCRSINVTGDYRIIFSQQYENTYLLLEIGTHQELYGN